MKYPMNERALKQTKEGFAKNFFSWKIRANKYINIIIEVAYIKTIARLINNILYTNDPQDLIILNDMLLKNLYYKVTDAPVYSNETVNARQEIVAKLKIHFYNLHNKDLSTSNKVLLYDLPPASNRLKFKTIAMLREHRVVTYEDLLHLFHYPFTNNLMDGMLSIFIEQIEAQRKRVLRTILPYKPHGNDHSMRYEDDRLRSSKVIFFYKAFTSSLMKQNGTQLAILFTTGFLYHELETIEVNLSADAQDLYCRLIELIDMDLHYDEFFDIIMDKVFDFLKYFHAFLTAKNMANSNLHKLPPSNCNLVDE
jgi:hypothetical protein